MNGVNCDGMKIGLHGLFLIIRPFHVVKFKHGCIALILYYVTLIKESEPLNFLFSNVYNVTLTDFCPIQCRVTLNINL